MKKLVCAGMLTILLTTSALAQGVDQASNKYSSLQDIPRPLRIMTNNGSQFPEQYISAVLTVIRQNGRDKKSIDQQDIEQSQNKRKDDQKRQALQQYISYDMDLDGRISRDEVIQFTSKMQDNLQFQPNRSDIQARQIDVVMKQDANGDGFVTLKEIGDFAAKNKAARMNYYNRFNDPSALLALDPNQDGRVTIEELEGLARKAFRTVDANGDGILTPDEIRPLQEINNQEAQMSAVVTSECHVSAASADEKIVYVGVYEGKAVSTMSVAGQVGETDVIPLNIEAGTSKIYLVTSSFSPVIWKISGDTKRISHLVLAGRSMPEGTDNNDSGDGKINIGATGVTADKVTFVHARDCGMNSGYEKSPQQQLTLRNILKGLLGRTPDLMQSEYGLSALGISDERLNTGVGADYELLQKKAPAGFDEATWAHHLMFMSGGLIDLKKEKIVSDVPAVAYEVLPKWAGISKLVHEGALVPSGGSAKSIVISTPGGQDSIITGIERVDISRSPGASMRMTNVASGYTFVKNVPYYPSGLYGGFSTQFTIKKGITPPKGIAGHSTVVCESTGATLVSPGDMIGKDAKCN